MKLLTLFLLFTQACASYKGNNSFKTIEDVRYGGSSRQQGDVYIPDGAGPFPGVILVHGGGWSSGDREDMNSIAESIASHGFVVFNINYRLAPKFRHPAPVEDLDQALAVFKEKAEDFKLKSSSIGLWGYSSGGHTVSWYALTRSSDPEKKVQAVVAGGTPHDVTWYPHSPYVKNYLGVYRDQDLDLYFKTSTPGYITKDAPPFFLYHSKEDRLVEWTQSTSFAARLKREGVAAEVLLMRFWGHTLTFVLRDEPIEKGVKFLKERLAP